MKVLLTKKVAIERTTAGVNLTVEPFTEWRLGFTIGNVLNGEPDIVLDVDEDMFNQVKVGQHYQISIEAIDTEAVPTV